MKREDVLAIKKAIMSDLERTGTLRVGLYGGPASGKSTTRAEVFSILKKEHVEIEEVTEVAKDYVWEKAIGKLQFQPLMMAKQMWRERRLEDQVDAIITDTSTLLSLVYGAEEHGVTPEFRAWIVAEYRKANRLDFFIDRNPNIPYNAAGRNQGSLYEAEKHDDAIIRILDEVGMPYRRLPLDGFTAREIAADVKHTLALMGAFD